MKRLFSVNFSTVKTVKAEVAQAGGKGCQKRCWLLIMVIRAPNLQQASQGRLIVPGYGAEVRLGIRGSETFKRKAWPRVHNPTQTIADFDSISRLKTCTQPG
jgi:hypothetical protein